MKPTITDLVQWADENGQDPIQVVQDYMLKKDSRITRIESERFVVQARKTFPKKTAVNGLLAALREHERVTGQICSISDEDVTAYLNEHLDLAAKLDGLDPEELASAIFDAIGDLGALELVENTIGETIEAAATQPEPDHEDPLDGDAVSALASAGFATDEDYGDFGPHADW